MKPDGFIRFLPLRSELFQFDTASVYPGGEHCRLTTIAPPRPTVDFEPGARRFRISSFAEWRGEDAPVWCATRKRAGWKMERPGEWNEHDEVKGFAWTAITPETWSRPHPSLPLLHLIMEISAIHQENGPWYVTRYRVLGGADPSNDLGFADWAEWEAGGDLLFARDGCLYRQCYADNAWQRPKMLADLTGNKFENVSPPAWATDFP